MKKLLLILGLFMACQIGTSQQITIQAPVDVTSGTDTIMYMKYYYDDGAIRQEINDTMPITELSAWLTGWEIWGQEQHNKWATYQLRDSLFTDSIQALILKYVP